MAPASFWAEYLGLRPRRSSSSEAAWRERTRLIEGAGHTALGALGGFSLAAGLGSLENNGWSGIGYITGAALVGWLAWAWLTCFIGTRILPRPETSADLGELLRTIGFASSPGILLVFALFPPISSCMARPRSRSARTWCGSSRRMKASRFSCSR